MIIIINITIVRYTYNSITRHIIGERNVSSSLLKIVTIVTPMSYNHTIPYKALLICIISSLIIFKSERMRSTTYVAMY